MVTDTVPHETGVESCGHTLYRFFDQPGALLYVGLTSDPGRRLRSHRSDKPWWTEIAQITMEHFASREALVAAERAAIQAERPKYNIVRYTGQRRQTKRQPEPPLPPREAVEKTVRYRLGGQITTAQLYLTYEVDYDCMSDDHDPFEWKLLADAYDKATRKWNRPRSDYPSLALLRRQAAQELFEEWETSYFEYDPVDINWFVSADDAGIFEGVKSTSEMAWLDCFNEQIAVEKSEWLNNFNHYFEILDGTRIADLPVRPKNWTLHGNKGGFITEAYDWVPKPLQPTVTLAELRGER